MRSIVSQFLLRFRYPLGFRRWHHWIIFFMSSVLHLIWLSYRSQEANFGQLLYLYWIAVTKMKEDLKSVKTRKMINKSFEWEPLVLILDAAPIIKNLQKNSYEIESHLLNENRLLFETVVFIKFWRFHVVIKSSSYNFII